MTSQQTSGKEYAAASQPLLETVRQQSSFEPLLNVAQAAKLLGGMHPKTLMRLAREAQLPALKLGRFWFFRATSLNAWIELSSIRPSVPCQKEISR